jgi:hypothetical protein
VEEDNKTEKKQTYFYTKTNYSLMASYISMFLGNSGATSVCNHRIGKGPRNAIVVFIELSNNCIRSNYILNLLVTEGSNPAQNSLLFKNLQRKFTGVL